MKQMKAFGQSILIIIWFYVVSLMSSLMVGLLSSNPTAFLERHSYLLNVISYAIIFLGVYWVDQHKEKLLEGLRVQTLKSILTYILMGIGTYIIGTVLASLLIGFFPDYEEISQSFTAYEPILRFIGMVMLPPLIEEYLFREKIQGYLKEGFGVTIALIGQALLFGGLHYYTVQKIYAAVLGFIFGIVKEKKNLGATIWMHMTVNFIGWLMGCLMH